MSTVHLILQGKGGVGKSFAAFLLAQYLPDKSVLVRCFDADPINNTLASFPALNAVKVDLIENSDKGRRIDPRRFDDLVEQITGQPAEAHVIVDTGSSAFVPLLHYVLSNEVQAILSQSGHQLGGPHDCYRRPGVARYSSRRGPAREAIGRRPVRDLAQSILGTGRRQRPHL